MRHPFIAIALLGLLASCGQEDAPKEQAKAPEGKPIALDPNPPMSTSEIDAIIGKHMKQPPPPGPQQKVKQ